MYVKKEKTGREGEERKQKEIKREKGTSLLYVAAVITQGHSTKRRKTVGNNLKNKNILVQWEGKASRKSPNDLSRKYITKEIYVGCL